MAPRPLITRFVLENYKSILFCDVRLRPLSILVGPNGAGKSNFLDALRFLSELMASPLASVIQKRGGFSRIYHRNAMGDARIGFRVELSIGKAKGHLSLRLRQDPRYGIVIDREQCEFAPSPASEGLPANFDKPDPTSHLRLLKEPLLDAIVEALTNCHFYHFNSESLRQPTPAYDEPLLIESGSNLPNVLHYIELHDKPAYQRLIEYLHSVNQTVTFVTGLEVNTYRTLMFKSGNGNTDFVASQMSDGTLRSLAVLAALFQNGLMPTNALVGLEEPETALHPAAAGVLFAAMHEASSNVQVIATTHSADLLDNEDVETDAILAVEISDGATRIAHVDHTGREALREKLYTAGALMRMNYLRPEVSTSPGPDEIEAILFGQPVPV